jgi:hypothetical protein
MTDPTPTANPTPARPAAPSSNPVFRRVLVAGAIIVVAVGVVASVVGALVAGTPGLWGALMGTALVLLLVSVTSASILIANRFYGSPGFLTAFFGIVLGAWVVKFVLFIVAVVLLRGQPWLDPIVLFVTLVVGLLASLAVDVIVAMRARLPYVSDLPERTPSE